MPSSRTSLEGEEVSVLPDLDMSNLDTARKFSLRVERLEALISIYLRANDTRPRDLKRLYEAREALRSALADKVR